MQANPTRDMSSIDAVVDKAMAWRGVTGVLVLSTEWLPIVCRGALDAKDAPELERLLSWTEVDAMGSIAWGEESEHSCIYFHKARTHTLILLKRQCSPSTPIGYTCPSTTLRIPDARRLATTTTSSLSAPSSSLETIKAARPRSWY